MSLSLKQELETWAAALKAYDEEDFETALQKFNIISESSKIQVNIGLIFATVGNHDEAVEHFRLATKYDQFLAVAYFQCGVSHFLVNRYEEAYQEFEDAILYLRGNQSIMYEQLGLKFTLYSCEVLFNKGLCLVNMGRLDEGLAVMREASREKANQEHEVIDEAIAARGQEYTVFSVPIGQLYRPSEVKLKNAKAKDYMGKAKLVASADPRDAYVSFVGATRLAQGLSPSGAPLTDSAARSRSKTMDANPSSAEVRMEWTPPVRRSEEGTRPTIMAEKSLPAGPPVARGLTIRREGVGGIAQGLPIGRGGTIRLAPAPAPKLDTNFNRSPIEWAEPRLPTPQMGSPVRGPALEEVVFSGMAAPSRNGLGLDVAGPRRRGSNDENLAPPRPAFDTRNTQMSSYDDLLDSYGDSAPVNSGQPGANKKLAQWARGVPEGAAPPIANSPPSPRMSGVPGLSFSASSTESEGITRAPTTIKRKITRRATTKGSRYVPVTLEDEEISDLDFEEVFELVKIRVKLHYRDDVRGMAISPSMGFDEFVDRITRKFDRPFERLEMKFNDEDGVQVSLKDESDFDLAIETARETAKGRPEGKLQVWLSDV